MVGFIVSVQVARYLGPENLGQLAYAQAIIGFVVVFSDLGIFGILTRELVKQKDKQKDLLWASFLIISVTSLLLFASTILVIILWQIEMITKWLILCMSFGLLFNSFSILNNYYESKARSKYISLSFIFTFLITSSLKIIFILFEVPVIYFGLFFSLEFFFSTFFLLYYYGWENFFRGHKKINLEIISSLIKYSLPFLLSTFSGIFFFNILQILLKNLLSAEKLGIYSIGTKIPAIYFSINSLIFVAIIPAIINAKKSNQELYHRRIKKVFSLVIYLALSFSMVIFFLSDKIIYFLYGSDFEESISILNIFIWVTIFESIRYSVNNWLVIENLIKYTLINNIASGILNLGLSFIFIKQYGLIGVAWAQLIYYFLGSYIFYSFFPKTRLVFKFITQSFFPYFLVKIKEF